MDNNLTLLGLGEVEYVEGGSFSFDDDANAELNKSQDRSFVLSAVLLSLLLKGKMKKR